jgi:hypothetical protein
VDAEESIPELLARLDREHAKRDSQLAKHPRFAHFCGKCLTDWPCETARLVAHIRSLEAALGDCLHRLGNMWIRLDVPPEEWARLKDEVTRGIGNTGNGNEYAWKLNWIACEAGRAALGEAQ